MNMNRKGDVFLASSFGEKDGDPRKWVTQGRKTRGIQGLVAMAPEATVLSSPFPLPLLSHSQPVLWPYFCEKPREKGQKNESVSYSPTSLRLHIAGHGKPLPSLLRRNGSAFHCVRGESSELAHESHRLRVWCLPPCWLSETQAEVARLSAAA